MHRIVVLGSGKVSKKNVTALVADLWESIDGDKRLVLPVPDPNPLFETDAFSAVAMWADATLVPYEVYVTEDPGNSGALRTHVVDDPIKAVVDILSPEDQILLAWDDEDQNCYRTLTLATKAGVVCKDLTMGLMTLELDEDVAEEPVTVTVPTLSEEVSEDPDEDDDLPVVLPLRDDDLMTTLTVFVEALRAQITREVLDAVRAEMQAPSKPRTRSSRRQQEGTNV